MAFAGQAHGKPTTETVMGITDLGLCSSVVHTANNGAAHRWPLFVT